jgi:hypothetical protein
LRLVEGRRGGRLKRQISPVVVRQIASIANPASSR